MFGHILLFLLLLLLLLLLFCCCYAGAVFSCSFHSYTFWDLQESVDNLKLFKRNLYLWSFSASVPRDWCQNRIVKRK